MLPVLASMLAPAPGLAAPVVATVFAVPAQSVILMVALLLAGTAAIWSSTVCASIVAVVSFLERLLVIAAVPNNTINPAMPTARTTIEIISSIMLMPRSPARLRASQAVILMAR